MSQPEERQQIIQAIKTCAYHTQGLLTVVIALFVAGVVALTVRDALESKRKATNQPLSVAERSLDNTVAIRVAVGADHQGRQVTFEFFIFPRNVRWAADDTDTVMIDNRELPATSIPAKLFTEKIKQRLAAADSILAFASSTTAGARILAAQIAGKRAATVAGWLAQVVPTTVPIYELNLASYHTPCAWCDTHRHTWRDAVIVVLVRKKEWRAAVGEALKDALSKPRNLPSPSRFSAFAIIQHERAIVDGNDNSTTNR